MKIAEFRKAVIAGLGAALSAAGLIYAAGPIQSGDIPTDAAKVIGAFVAFFLGVYITPNGPAAAGTPAK